MHMSIKKDPDKVEEPLVSQNRLEFHPDSRASANDF